MIAGLLVSTFLTLFVIPAATYLAYVDKSKQQTKVNIFNLGNIRKLISFIFLGSLFSFAVLDVHADPLILNWKDIVKKAEDRLPDDHNMFAMMIHGPLILIFQIVRKFIV